VRRNALIFYLNNQILKIYTKFNVKKYRWPIAEIASFAAAPKLKQLNLSALTQAVAVL